MKKKGFTLIELLAVIVILAIIAIIAVPTITKVVDKARKGAAEASALNYIDAVEKYIMLHDVNPTKYPYDIKGGTFNVASSTEISLLDIIIPKAKAENSVPSLNSFITVKGDKPDSGTITTNEKGKVTDADLAMGGYSVVFDNGVILSTKSSNSACVDDSIIDKENVTVAVSSLFQVSAKEGYDVTWISSNSNVASITSDGIIKAKNIGETVITATAGKKTDELFLTVKGGGFVDLSDVYSTGTSSPVKQAGLIGVLYLDPKNVNHICDGTENVGPYKQTGCMKWYIYSESDTKYTAILAYNMGSSDSSSPTLAQWELNSNLNARYISKSELDTITGRTESYYFDGSQLSTQGSSAYAWLFDYLYSCTSYGCSVAYDSSNNGGGFYMTSDMFGRGSSRTCVLVEFQGNVGTYGCGSSFIGGIRPVIEVPKSYIFNL